MECHNENFLEFDFHNMIRGDIHLELEMFPAVVDFEFQIKWTLHRLNLISIIDWWLLLYTRISGEIDKKNVLYAPKYKRNYLAGQLPSANCNIDFMKTAPRMV